MPFHLSESGSIAFGVDLHIRSKVDLSIYDVKSKTEFLLSTQPPGIYMVNVMMDGKMEIVKVIRY